MCSLFVGFTILAPPPPTYITGTQLTVSCYWWTKDNWVEPQALFSFCINLKINFETNFCPKSMLGHQQMDLLEADTVHEKMQWTLDVEKKHHQIIFNWQRVNLSENYSKLSINQETIQQRHKIDVFSIQYNIFI